jgi:hypothetical protein
VARLILLNGPPGAGKSTLASVARFESRLDAPHSGAVRDLVAADGGPEAVVTAYVTALDSLPGGHRLDAAGDMETTYAALVAMLDR